MIIADKEKYVDLLLDALYIDPKTVLNIGKGHSIDLHCGLSDMEMCERIIKEQKDAVSSFYIDESYENENDSALMYISDAIDNKAEEIYDWLTTTRKEFVDPRDYNRKIITLNLGKEPIGHGYKSDMKEYVSSVITIVISRDFSSESNFGFYIKTAYCDITEGTLTGKYMSLMNMVQESQKLTKWEKLRELIQRQADAPYNCKLYEDNSTGEVGIRFSKAISIDEKYVFYITNRRQYCVHFDLDEKETLTPEQIMNKAPEIYNYFVSINKDLELIELQKPELLKTVRKNCQTEEHEL